MSQCNPRENILVYIELKSNDIWQLCQNGPIYEVAKKD